tara:strand:+ start:313 stop:690 length:378 start_codon:yes stop_codon:yes gene_type:complete
MSSPVASVTPTVTPSVEVKESPVPVDTYTVMIPWAEVWVDEERVSREFREAGFGNIDKVDLVERTEGKREHLKIFVHISSINSEYKTHLDGGSEIKVFYNGNYFWKVRKSTYVHRVEGKSRVELC